MVNITASPKPMEKMRKTNKLFALPSDCTEWLEWRSAVTGDSQTQIVKNLIRHAIRSSEGETTTQTSQSQA